MNTRNWIASAPQYQLGKTLVLREWDGMLTRVVLEQVLNVQHPNRVIVRYLDGLRHNISAKHLASIVVGIWEPGSRQMLSDGFDIPVVRRGWLQRVH